MDNQDDTVPAPTISIGNSNGLWIQSPPPDRLILRDEAGWPWAISIQSNGVLRLEKQLDDSENGGV